MEVPPAARGPVSFSGPLTPAAVARWACAWESCRQGRVGSKDLRSAVATILHAEASIHLTTTCVIPPRCLESVTFPHGWAGLGLLGFTNETDCCPGSDRLDRSQLSGSGSRPSRQARHRRHDRPRPLGRPRPGLPGIPILRAALSDESQRSQIPAGAFPRETILEFGPDAVARIAAMTEADIVLSGIVGAPASAGRSLPSKRKTGRPGQQGNPPRRRAARHELRQRAGRGLRQRSAGEPCPPQTPPGRQRAQRRLPGPRMRPPAGREAGHPHRQRRALPHLALEKIRRRPARTPSPTRPGTWAPRSPSTPRR